MSSHFDLVDFRLFANIAECQSFTAGAARSNLSTSAASLRIRNLEESLGGRLFHRTSQGSSLTPGGEAALEHVNAILARFETLKSDMSEHGEVRKELLRIVVSNSGINEPLPSVMHQYKSRHPSVSLSLHVAMSHEVAPAVADGSFDIGIGGSREAKIVKTFPYLNDRLVLITPPGHPLAAQKSVRFSEVLDHEVIGLPESSGVQRFMRRIEQNSRKPLRISVSVSSNEALRQMVEANFGVGVLSERVAKLFRSASNVCVIPLKDTSAATDIQICVASGRHLPDHAAEFVQMLQAAGDTRT